MNSKLPSYIFRFLLLLLFSICKGSFGQDSSGTITRYINASGHYGFIIAHHSNMDYLIKKHVPAGEISIIQSTDGTKEWQRTYKNPEIGLGFFFADLGNPQQLGQAAGIFPIVNFPLNPGRKFKLFLRVSDGIGYISKPFESASNHKNNIIGSRLNAFINLRLNTVFFPAKLVRMEAGIGLTHFSNATWAIPNLGINLATIHLGIGFGKTISIKHTTYTADTLKTLPAEKKYNLFFISGAGLTEISPPDGKKYLAYSLSANATKTVSAKSRFGAGLDFYYNTSYLAYVRKDTILHFSNDLQNIQMGFKCTYELIVGKFSLPFEMGVYLYSKTNFYGMWYHRIGIRYQASKHFIINYGLKTHFAKAEHFEFGVGYKL